MLRGPFRNLHSTSGEPLVAVDDGGPTPIIMSNEGVRQGDVLGPLLFCIALKPVLDALNAAVRKQFGARAESLGVYAYMDDIALTVPTGVCSFCSPNPASLLIR